MRNLKKVLALALAFALAFSVMSGAVIYSDSAESSPDGYVQASIDIMYKLGIMVGTGTIDPSTSVFKPTEPLSRAELTSVIFALMNKGLVNSDKADVFRSTKLPFTDVPTNPDDAWYRGRLGYCYVNELLSGKSATTFDPEGDVTTQELATVLLAALGYEKADLAKGWPANVLKFGLDKGLFENVIVALDEAIPRQYVAVMIANALRAIPVAKDPDTKKYYDVAVNIQARMFSAPIFSGSNSYIYAADPFVDQLAYKLFGKTLYIYTDRFAYYSADTSTALTNAGKASSGIKLDILKVNNKAYYNDNVAFTIGTSLKADPELSPLGAIVSASFYAMIDFNYVIDIDVTGSGSGSTPNGGFDYSIPSGYNATFEVVSVAEAPVAGESSLNNQNKIYTNITTGFTPSGDASATKLAFTGTENDLTTQRVSENKGMNSQASDDKTFISINGATPAVPANADNFTLGDKTYDSIVNALRAGADRPFDKISKVITNKDGYIIYVSKLERKIAKVMEVKNIKDSNNNDVKYVVLEEMGLCNDPEPVLVRSEFNYEVSKFYNDDGTAFDFGAIRDLVPDYGDEAFYIAYYKGADGKYYAVKIGTDKNSGGAYLSREKITKNVEKKIYNAEGVEIAGYDPYVHNLEKIAVADTAAAIALVGKTYDIIRGPAGKILFTNEAQATVKPADPTPYGKMTVGVLLDTLYTPGSADVFNPSGAKIQAQILKADGTKQVIDVEKIGDKTVDKFIEANGLNTDTALSCNENKLISYSIANGKLTYAVLADKAPTEDKDGVEVEFKATTNGNKLYENGTFYGYINSNATVFAAKTDNAGVITEWSVFSGDKLANVANTVDAANDSVVYDNNTATGYKNATALLIKDSAVAKIADPTPTITKVLFFATEDTKYAKNVSFDGTNYTFTLKGVTSASTAFTSTKVMKAADVSAATVIVEAGKAYELTFKDGLVDTISAALDAPSAAITVSAYDAAAKTITFSDATSTLCSTNNAVILAYKTVDGKLTGQAVPTSLAGKKVAYVVLDGTNVKYLIINLD